MGLRLLQGIQKGIARWAAQKETKEVKPPGEKTGGIHGETFQNR